MGVGGFVRSNWRVLFLVVLLLASTFALFSPSDDPTERESGDGLTNLQYGIQLDGGTRLRAPVVGVTAEDVDVTPENVPDVERGVATELGVETVDVTARPPDEQGETGTVEVFVKDVTPADLGDALAVAGYEVPAESIRDGVTDETRGELVEVIGRKISEAGLGGGNVREVSTPGGNEHFIVVEAPDRDADELRSLLEDRGVVRVVAYYPDENGTYHNETVLERGDFSSIGTAEYTDQLGHHVPVTVSEARADEFARTMVELGFGDGSTCEFGEAGGYGNIEPPQRCMLTIRDGQVVYSAPVAGNLGESFEDGSFVQRPQFVMQTTNRSEAQQLSIDLRAGALPAPLDFDAGTTFSLEPALADRFKSNSLLTGFIAVLAVSFAVYLRYGSAKVAAPMVVTALSEVVVLLGFAAAIGYPLDLSVIAGFIAVIGTGVDDLIIIADEVMSEGEVHSRRVFRSRFRKAFWVIGAAAATTIVAMAPLARLSLGDLQGFAIITILGVLVGVLVTRPAYGDILRMLLTDQ